MDRYGSEIQASKMFNFYFWRFKSENLVIIITPTTKGREEVTTVIFFRGGGDHGLKPILLEINHMIQLFFINYLISLIQSLTLIHNYCLLSFVPLLG